LSVIELKYPKPRNYPIILNPQTIGECLRNERLKRGLFQREVAELLSVHHTSVEHWEVNHSQPQLKFYPRIIKFIGFTPDFCKEIPQLKSEIFLKRIELGLSQKMMAKKIGIDVSTLVEIERNGRQMTKRTAHLIHKINH